MHFPLGLHGVEYLEPFNECLKGTYKILVEYHNICYKSPTYSDYRKKPEGRTYSDYEWYKEWLSLIHI